MSQPTYTETYAPKNKLIVVSGIIGVGKSTLTKDLADKLDATPYYEPVESNEYLDLFYEDKAKYGFPMQVYLLNHRFRQHQQMVWCTDNVVQDRSIYEDVIFAKMLKESGDMSELDFETYRSLYLNMTNFLHRPDLVVYLDTDPEIALERINRRGRECESGMSLEYLESLKKGYEEWLLDVEPRIPVLRLNWNEFRDTEDVIKMINDKFKERKGLVF